MSLFLQHFLNVTGEVLSVEKLDSISTVSVFFGTVEDTMRLIAPQLSVNSTRMENQETGTDTDPHNPLVT